MIKTLSISNFQSHRKSELVFVPGVNVIVGSSDSGKTAVLRALNWIVNNRPSGEGFRSHWGGITEVVADFGGTIINRSRTDSKNLYQMDDQIYEAFGRGVPEEVTDVINMTDLNAQRQLDAPFLLSKSSGEVAQILNESVNLSDIDRSLSTISGKVRGLNKDITDLKESLEEKEKELESLDYVEDLEKRIASVETLLVSQEKYEYKVQRISNLLAEGNRIESDIEDISLLLESEEDIIFLVEKIQELEQELDKVERLKNISIKMAAIQVTVDRLNKMIALEKDILELEELMLSYSEVHSNVYQLNFELIHLESTAGFLEDAKYDVKDKEANLYDVMPDICPLCGQEVKK